MRVYPIYQPFITLLIILAQVISFAQGTWERITVPTNQFLSSVCFVDSLYGWSVGDSGTIIHTSDGGKNWIVQDSKTDKEIGYVFFLNRKLGWASSYNYSSLPYGTILLKTNDGGANWTSYSYPEEDIFITCILFLDSLNGWMGGMPHALVRTTDGGLNWQQATVDTSTLAFFPVMGIQFLNPRIGYAYGGIFDIAGVIWRTTNGGQNWYAIDASDAPADEVRGLHIFDSLRVMGAGGDPDYGFGVGMIRSSDGGLNWEYEDIGLQGIAYDLDFRTKGEAWAPLGSKNRLIYSLDSGMTWKQLSTPDSTSIYTVTFSDSLHGFAVGRNGAVLKYHPPLYPSVNPNSFTPADDFILYQNYPNPFHSTTTIKLTVPSASVLHNFHKGKSSVPIQIKIFDLFGNEVLNLLNENKLPGNYEIEVNTSNLPCGIYFYQLTAGFSGQIYPLTSIKKMVKMSRE